MAASATRSSKLLALWLCCALPLIMSSTAADTTTATTAAALPGGAGEGQSSCRCRASSDDDLDGGGCRYDFQEDTSGRGAARGVRAGGGGGVGAAGADPRREPRGGRLHQRRPRRQSGLLPRLQRLRHSGGPRRRRLRPVRRRPRDVRLQRPIVLRLRADENRLAGRILRRRRRVAPSLGGHVYLR
uniref:Uncharacterized protein n=1 Tax=Oryza glaberrima TaxID=4538 RepID=I1R969_ORYGL